MCRGGFHRQSPGARRAATPSVAAQTGPAGIEPATPGLERTPGDAGVGAFVDFQGLRFEPPTPALLDNAGVGTNPDTEERYQVRRTGADGVGVRLATQDGSVQLDQAIGCSRVLASYASDGTVSRRFVTVKPRCPVCGISRANATVPYLRAPPAQGAWQVAASGTGWL